MKLSSMWLTVATVAGLAQPAMAAPAPAPPVSSSPIADALRLMALLPRTSPLTAQAARIVKEGVLGLERPTFVTKKFKRTVVRMVQQQKVVTVNIAGPGGKVEAVQRTVTEVIPVYVEEEDTIVVPGEKVGVVEVSLQSCKIYTVTGEGKLEALGAEKAAGTLKKRTAILTGPSADVDPRALQLIKPGTLCVILPPAPSPPDRKP